MALQVWMKREQWLIWIAAAIVLTLVLAAIGYLAVEQAASFSGPVAIAAHDKVGPVPRQPAWQHPAHPL
jgi:nicotinamide riboside transporter PnuC